MWKIGDLVRQSPGIFRIEEVAGKPMTIVDIIYTKGKASGWPLEVITQCDGRLYHWNPEGLMPYTGRHDEYSSRTVHGGSSFD